MGVNGTLVEAKLCTFTLECAHFIFNLCPIYSHDGASAKLSTNSQETDYSVEQPRQDTNLSYRHNVPIGPTKEGPLSFVLHKSQIASDSTVSRGHPSLVSLCLTNIFCSLLKAKSLATLYGLYTSPPKI